MDKNCVKLFEIILNCLKLCKIVQIALSCKKLSDFVQTCLMQWLQISKVMYIFFCPQKLSQMV